MTPAADDFTLADAIEAIRQTVTTDDAPSVCEKCRGMGFLWKDRTFPSRAIPCRACEVKKETK